ncbi:hypothetical protein [Nocardia brasiliensis]|uniref:hypothetical protein n=1 Tax=Nocardia brasiliensis TaxID=37326 RepID=UPI003D8FB69B
MPDQQPSRPGRKRGPLRGETAELNALAQLLRELMDEAALTSEDLQQRMSPEPSLSTISNRLAGVGLTWTFVEDVVNACTERPDQRQKRPQYRALAKRRWEIAQTDHTSPVIVDAKTSQGSLNSAVIHLQRTAIDLHDRLHAKEAQLAAARTARAHAELALRSASALAAALAPWVLILLNEIEYLSHERNVLASAYPLDRARLGALDTDIAQIRNRHKDTARDLAAAETKRGLAVELLASSVTIARQLHRDMQQLRQTAGDVDDFDTMSAGISVVEQRLDLEFTLDSIDDVHDHAVSATTAITNQLDEAMAILATIDGSLRRGGPASGGSASLWWEMIADVPADVLAWAEDTAQQLIRTRNVHDPRIATTAQSHPVREIILLADTLWRFGWLEGSARTWDALALHRPATHVVQIADALRSEPWRYSSPTRIQPESKSTRGTRILRVALTARPLEDALAIHAMVAAQMGGAADSCAALLFQRTDEDIVQMFVHALHDDGSDSTTALVKQALRSMSAEAVLGLVDNIRISMAAELYEDERERLLEEDVRVLWSFAQHLPLDRTGGVGAELLVRIWMTNRRWLLLENFGQLYHGRYDQLLDELLVAWPPHLEEAARELAEEVFRQANNRYRDGGGTLKFVARALKDAGVDPTAIFGPKILDLPHLTGTDDQ